MNDKEAEVMQAALRTPRTVEQEVWLLAQPLAVEALVSQGVLKRNGDWYEVTQPRELPEHVLVKIREVRSESGKLLVQLPHSSKASQLIAEQMGIDWRGPKPS